jgi:hypothetical protein
MVLIFVKRSVMAGVVAGLATLAYAGTADAVQPTAHDVGVARLAPAENATLDFGLYGSFRQCDDWWVQISQDPNWISATSCTYYSSSGVNGWYFEATFKNGGPAER